MYLRHCLSILMLPLLGSALAPAQNIDALPSITGAEIVPANDKILVRDASVSAAAGAMRSMTLSELANVPGLFDGVGGGDLTSGPVTSAEGVSSIADGALSIAKTTGLQASLDGKLPVINIKSYGAVGDGVANDTAAIQAAITAAATSPLTRTVYAPPGRYKCNVVIPPEVKLIGAGGGLRYNFDVPPAGELADRTVIPTVFTPNSTALPVIKIPEFFGNHLADFMVAGTVAKIGTGIRFGGDVSIGYTGSSGTMDRVQVSGFEKAYWNDGAVDVIHNACIFVDSVYCVYYSGGTSIAPGDTNIFNSCITGGINADYCFYMQGRAVLINTGDHNLAKHMLYMTEGSIVTITTLNSEQISQEPIQVVSGWLNIQGGRFTPVDGNPYPLIRVYGPTTVVQVSDTIQTSGVATRKGKSMIYSTGDMRTPNHLPRGYAIERYSDYTYTTYRRTDLTSWTHRGTPTYPIPSLADDFIANKTAAPYGSLGWQYTQVGAGGLVLRHADPGSAQFGVMEIICALNNSVYGGRLAIPDNVFVATNMFYNWRMTFSFALAEVADINFRAGLYDLSGAASLTPANGVGIRVQSATDTNLQLEFIAAGVSTLVDTGIARTTLTDFVGVTLERTPEGVYCWITSQSMGGNNQIGSEVFKAAPLPATYMSPAITLGNRTGTYAGVALDRFSLDFYEP